MPRRDLERALAIDEKAFPPGHPRIAQVLFNLGEIASLQDQLPAAIDFHTRALELRRKAQGEHHPQVTESYLALAGDQLARRDFAASRASCEAARRSAAGSNAKNAELLGAIEACVWIRDASRAASRRARADPRARARAHGQSQDDPGSQPRSSSRSPRAAAGRRAARAKQLAATAREIFVHEGATRRRELAELDRWLQRP